ncbi:hypothetical protein [Anaerotignum sp.]|uniref:hypothetical protein n=1 Tax=Anaerotignum sp. TaxID=2039241 RepID=UPI002A918F1C|nr:hypothetical protein [Anaerotignum sp.]MCI7657720.1 hypothetical protein [Clostridia bacterium]MDY5414697.1 hypothetical protein [Anaerotignum sp.]
MHFRTKDEKQNKRPEKAKKIKKNKSLVLQAEEKREMPVLLEKQALQGGFTCILCCFKYREIVQK